MYFTPQSLKQPQLKSTELVILKSLALGLDCDTIKNLLGFSDEDFEKNSIHSIQNYKFVMLLLPSE
jgi:hypothetical protein